MSFFEDASLVLIPSAQKTSKVYSVKPTDGSGDLSFTRTADTATRVGPDGLIEKVRTNLFRYSEQFNNTAAWQYQGSPIISANASVAPDGTTTADLLYPSVNGSVVAAIQSITSASSVEYTQSVYVKASGKNFVALYTFNGTTGTAMWVNLTTGAITNGVDANVSNRFATNVGNGWWRIGFTDIGNGTTTYIHVYPTDAASSNDVTASGTNGILLWGAQLETGVLTPYIATTSAAVSVGPVANVPRLDYLNSSCPRLLLEPQRQNLFLQSEAINNAAWNAARYTRTANQTASPSGYVDADQCTPTATTGTHEIFPATGISFSATAYTMSLFAKYNGYNISLGVAGDSSNWTGCVFDLQNGIAKTPQSAGSQSVCTAKIEDYGSGWYRCSITFTPYTTPTFYPTFGAVNSANATLGAWGAQEFTANGTSGTYLWGCQLEAGAYATSYIPTLGASVTRGADACSKTGISSLIGQTEGTIFIDFVWRNSLTDVVPFDITGSDGKLIWMRDVGAQFYGNGTTLIADIGRTGAVQGTRYKIAFVYGQNDFRLYRNGSLIGTDTSGTFTGTFSDIALNSVINQANGFNQILLFKTKLTNAQLAELTA